MEDLHNPVRLEGETQRQYKLRRSLSAKVAKRGKAIHRYGDGQHTASTAKAAKRQLVAAVGARQAKRHMREARRNFREGVE